MVNGLVIITGASIGIGRAASIAFQAVHPLLLGNPESNAHIQIKDLIAAALESLQSRREVDPTASSHPVWDDWIRAWFADYLAGIRTRSRSDSSVKV